MPFVKRAWTHSLSARVMVAYIAGVVLSVLLIVAVIEGLLRFNRPLFVEGNVAQHAHALAEELQFDAAGTPIGLSARVQPLAWIFEAMKDDLAYRVLDGAGQVALQSPAGAAFWPAGGGPPQTGRVDFDQGGRQFRSFIEQVEYDDHAWFVQLAASARLAELGRPEFGLRFMGMGILLFSAVLLFVFGLCAFVTMRYVQRPLRAVSASAAAISPRSLHARLPSDGVPTEVAPLVESFNRVLERLERGYRVQQEFLATAAHELKTPLALIRAQIELQGGSGDRDALLQDVAHMTRQVQQLLLLAEASEAHNYEFAETAVLDIAQEAASYLRRMAEAAGVRIEVSAGSEDIEWRADRSALFTLLKNLLENAVQHAPAGTVVHLNVEATSLSVRDRGPGVAPEQLQHLFERFWRGAHRRDHGAGLGLPICQEIAQAHGWALAAQPAHPGLRLVLSREGVSSA